MKLVVFYLSGCINLSLVPTGKSDSDSDMTKSFFDDFGSSGYSQMWKKTVLSPIISKVQTI